MPIFETNQDRINEEEVVKLFANKSGYSYNKLDDFDLDFVLIDNQGRKVCYLEIKCYNTMSDQFRTAMHSVYKYEKLMKYDKKLPTFFVCRYKDDVVHYIRAKDIKGEIRISGRKNPRPNAYRDRERCIFIDRKLFKTL